MTTVLFVLIAAGSFAWSVVSTQLQQPIAYFDTTTRIWEFTAGSLLALWPAANAAAPIAPRSRRLRTVLGWAGLAAPISTGALIDGRSMFPGWIALLPLLGATGVFLAGTTGSRLGADRLLASRPFSFLGDVSYGLYLIHWPILTIAVVATGRERAGLLLGTVIIMISLVLAWLVTRLVDTPIRRWRWANARPLRAGMVVAMVMAVGLAPTLGAQNLLQRAADEAERSAYANNPGARVLDPDYTPHPDAAPDAPPLPSAATLQQDWAHLELPCEDDLAPPEGEARAKCRMTEAPEDAPVIVAVGNSRLGQAAMSLAGPARANGWRLVIIWTPSCVFTPGIPSYKGPECDAHNLAVKEHLLELQPEAVALATSQLPGEGPERIGRVTETTMPELMDEGIDIIALRDTARVLEDPVGCLETGGTVESCTQEISREVMPEVRTDAEVLQMHSGRGGAEVYPVDLLSVTCPEYSCPPIIGNVHVMFDVDHLTATYAESAGSEVQHQLDGAGFPW